MAVWAALASLVLGMSVILTMDLQADDVVRAVLELAGIVAVFGLICAHEARQPK